MAQPCYINDLLSDDILREIFTHLTFIDILGIGTYPSRAIRQERAPLLPTYVCSRWRQVAIGTRCLWSTLLMAIPPLLVPCGRQELYRMWLNRARGAPVFLEIVDVPKSDKSLLGTADWIGFILEHVPNLRCLSTGAHVAKAFIRGLLSRPEGGYQHLEALRIDLPSRKPIKSDCIGKIPTLFPKLAQLHVDTESYHAFVDLPTNQFTHLTCSTFFFKALLSPGPRNVTFSGLVRLELRGRYDKPLLFQTRPEHKRLIFPEVRMILVKDDESLSVTRSFLPAIDAPRLEVLHVDAGNHTTTPIAPSLPDSGNSNFFAECLSEAPSLRHIVVHRGHARYLTPAFLNDRDVRSRLDYVHIELSVRSNSYYTDEEVKVAFEKSKWKEQGLGIAFKSDPIPGYDEYTVYVGWSRAPGHPLGKPYCGKSALAHWDR